MKKQPFSKTIVLLSVLIAVVFLTFTCAEMHRQNTLEPVSYIAADTMKPLALVVACYMWRAKQSDLYNLEVKKMQQTGKKTPLQRVPEDFSGDPTDYEFPVYPAEEGEDV